MPELPEVEVTRRGLLPHLEGARIVSVWHDELKLRAPWPQNLAGLEGASICTVERRSKYLLLPLRPEKKGLLYLHLGMTGHVRVEECAKPRLKHDHLEIRLMRDGQERVLRFNDSRRFGLVGWATGRASLMEKPPFCDLGPEPLESGFDGTVLERAFKGRKLTVKQALLSGHAVVGVGNIYASEALFSARIDPRCPAGKLTAAQCQRLAGAIVAILTRAIASGGTTIRDFAAVDGKPGYFVQKLQVYGRVGQPCPRCGGPVTHLQQGQRSTFFCPACQR